MDAFPPASTGFSTIWLVIGACERVAISLCIHGAVTSTRMPTAVQDMVYIDSCWCRLTQRVIVNHTCTAHGRFGRAHCIDQETVLSTTLESFATVRTPEPESPLQTS